jgi:predicted aldo/keto reductase-like oxidoreductase
MKNGKTRWNRRDFLKAGLAGTTAAFLGTDALARTMKTSTGQFVFPRPVYRTLGRTGLKVTIVSFGAMLTPEPEVIRYAFDHGVNYVDTARRYMGGRNEEYVGRALKGVRDRVYVATKTRPDSASRNEIIRDVETSLRTLGIDYIDVIQLHSLTDRERIFNQDTKAGLLKLREQGKVRFFGVTTHTNQAEVLNALVDDPDRFFDTALVAYNFKSGRDVRDAIARAAKAGVGIIGMKNTAGGYRTDAMGPFTPYQAAIKWVLADRNVATVIPGMRNMAELREDVAVMGMKLGYFDRLILERYGRAIDSYYCRMCAECEAGCPHGVAISTINRALMYKEAYRSAELARATYRELPAACSADACLECGSCAARCPNGLDIRDKMARARRMLS